MTTSAENKIIKSKPPTPKTFEHEAIKIGVVPEHFSTPFHLGLERDIFNERDLNVDVIEYPRGTGSMCTALREGQLDVAVALTEGLVSDIIKNGNDVFKICGTYVNSPLKWGIVVNPNSSRGVNTLKDLHDKTIGISRYGSGSHIMSFLLAEQEHWYKQEGAVHSDDHDLTINFKVCGGLDDLRNGVKTESVDTFLWETFMLKHFVDEGELKQVGDISTPWPCFMIAVRNDVIKKNREQIERLFDTITYCAKLFYQERQESLNFISSSCHLQMEDAEKWYKTVQFAENTRHISEKVLEDTKKILQRAKVLSTDVDIKTVYNTDFVQL